jgi:hypothetical protein
MDAGRMQRLLYLLSEPVACIFKTAVGKSGPSPSRLREPRVRVCPACSTADHASFGIGSKEPSMVDLDVRFGNIASREGAGVEPKSFTLIMQRQRRQIETVGCDRYCRSCLK